MKKGNKKQLFITTLCTLLPLVVGLLLWNDLPTSMPVHFNFAGEPNGFAPKTMVIFGLNLFLAVIHLVTLYFVMNDPKNDNIGNKMFSVVTWVIPVIGNITSYAIYAFALGYHINMTMIVAVLLGILFIVIGNYMTKNHQNYTVGIKLPWTLNSTENWNKTHRFASKLWIACGFIAMIAGFLGYIGLFLASIILPAILPIIYSFVLYKQGI